MTNGNRFIRKITDDPRCLVCGVIKENVEHVVRRCPAARLVWQKIGVDMAKICNDTPFADWIQENLDVATADVGEEWPKLFVVTCWWLWRWRKERCFRENPNIPINQAAFIFARVGIIKQALERNDLVIGKKKVAKVEVLIRWQFPPIGWVRLNTDGASKGNPGRSGGGGIIRGCSGEVHEVFAISCGHCTCTRAELLAALKGLSLAHSVGYEQVWLTVDSEVVVNLLAWDITFNYPYIHLIKKCKALIMVDNWKVKVDHCFREANRAADWLANYGVTMNQNFELIEAIPMDLKAVLLEDISGFAYPRTVSEVAE